MPYLKVTATMPCLKVRTAWVEVGAAEVYSMRCLKVTATMPCLKVRTAWVEVGAAEVYSMPCLKVRVAWVEVGAAKVYSMPCLKVRAAWVEVGAAKVYSMPCLKVRAAWVEVGAAKVYSMPCLKVIVPGIILKSLLSCHEIGNSVLYPSAFSIHLQAEKLVTICAIGAYKVVLVPCDVAFSLLRRFIGCT